MAVPLVTVVLPSYNHAAWLGEAIRSVLTQSDPRWHLLVIDDGSSDGSVAVARGFNDSRITVLPQANQGAHAAINRGLDLARTPFAAILNSDDIWRPRRLERLLVTADRQPDSLLFTDLAVVDAWGRLDLGRMWGPHIDLRQRCGAWSLPRVLRRGNLAHTTSNFFAPTNLFRELGGMRPLRYVHDWDFLLRALARHRVHRLDETLLDYRIHDRNTILEGSSWRHFAEAGFMAGIHLLRMELDEQDPLADQVELVAGNPCFPAALALVFQRVHEQLGEQAALDLATTEAGLSRLTGLCTSHGLDRLESLLPPLGIMATFYPR